MSFSSIFHWNHPYATFRWRWEDHQSKYKIKDKQPLKYLDLKHLLDVNYQEHIKNLPDWYFLFSSIQNIYETIYKEFTKSNTTAIKQKYLLHVCQQMALSEHIPIEELEKAEVKKTIFKIQEFVNSTSFKSSHPVKECEEIRQSLGLLILKYSNRCSTNSQKSRATQQNKNPIPQEALQVLNEIRSDTPRYRIKELFKAYLSSSPTPLLPIGKAQHVSDPEWLAQILAKQIMFYQKFLFKKLLPQDMSHPSKMDLKGQIAEMDLKGQIAELSNRFARMLMREIVSYQNQKNQCLKLLLLCHHLKNYLWNQGDFQSAMAVYTGLTSSPVLNLIDIHREFAHRYPEQIKKQEQFNELITPFKNFANFRNLFNKWEKEGKSFIPYIEIYCKDSTILVENRAFITGEKLNLESIHTFENILHKLLNPIKNFKTQNPQTDLLEILNNPDLTAELEGKLYAQSSLKNYRLSIRPE